MFRIFGRENEFSGNQGLFPGQPHMDPQTRASLNRGIDKLSAAASGLFSTLKNPRAVARAIFTKQNVTEIVASASIMAAAKAGVVAIATTLNAPLVALYAATVATGGVVGGFLRTWKDWRNSQREANAALAQPNSTTVSLRDEFARKAYQGYFDYAFENKRLLKNMAKSAFTTAAGGAIGVAAHSAFDAVSNLNLFASAPDSITPVTSPSPTKVIPLSPVPENTVNDVKVINTDTLALAAVAEPALPAPAVSVSDAAEKMRTDEFAAKIKDVIDATSDEAPAPETPPPFTTKELNERSLAAINTAASAPAASVVESTGDVIVSDEAKITIDPAVFDDDTVTSGTPVTEPQEFVVETSTPKAPAQSPQATSPILPQGVAAQCVMGDDNQTVNCIARADGKIATGEKLRMVFGDKSAPTLVDFENGDTTKSLPRFIDRLRGFAPFEAWRASAPVVTAQPE